MNMNLFYTRPEKTSKNMDIAYDNYFNNQIDKKGFII